MQIHQLVFQKLFCLDISIKLLLMANPFKSIENQIVLPKTYKLLGQQTIFKPIKHPKDEQAIYLSEALYAKTNSLIQELNAAFELFEKPQQFRFKFPESMFPPVGPGQANNIRYEQKMITQQENTFKDRLSQQQLRDIQETGSFKVKSNIQYITLPYVWRINQTIFWGKQKVKQVWNLSMATIFGYFWTAKRIMQQKIPLQLQKLATYPKKIIHLLVGLKSIKTVIEVNYQRQIFKDFWSKILTQYYHESDQWCSALWNYLYVYYNPELSRPLELSSNNNEATKQQNKRNKLQQQYNDAIAASKLKTGEIQKIQEKFYQEWEKLKKKVIIEITAECSNYFQHKKSNQEEPMSKANENNNDTLILQKLAEKKFTLYVQHLRNELPKKSVSVGVINAIVFILKLFNLLTLKTQKKQKLKQKKRLQVMQNIRSLHKIKSLFTPFFTQMVNSEITPIEKAIDEEFYEEILKDKEIVGLLSRDQIQAVKEFIKLRGNYNALIEAKKKAVPQYLGPSRVFQSNYHLLPPYKVLQDKNKYYSLKKISDNLTVDTSTNFWKIKLYIMRLKTWTMNFLFFLVAAAWKGPLGLRCLWGIQHFTTQMLINYQTGQIHYQYRQTVIGTFKIVLEGIKKSRTQFQQAPDLGLLGKNMSRYANYFQCYIFRFLFVGVILTLIGYPILILVGSTLAIVLVLSFWAWVPIIMAICYVFNILIKQFQTPIIQYGFWSRSFPIVRLILGIIKCFIIILFTILNLILLAPIKSFFLLLYCSIQHFFRRFFDFLLVFLFRKVGRTPSRDTNIARKISGPGMTKDFYMSINEEDVYVLVQSRMEQIYLQKFNQLLLEKIQSHRTNFTNTLAKVLAPFSVNYSANNKLIANINSLLEVFRNQNVLHYNRYPQNPYNVRFTQQQIDNYFENTVTIVRRFVDKHQLGWIFDQYHLYEGMYDQLTRSVWVEIFGCGQEIFEPLQKLDSRFKLEDQYQQDEGVNVQMKRKVGSVMKALQGEVKLEHNHKKLAPFKHNLLTRQTSTDQISAVFTYHELNSIQNVRAEVKDIKILFVPNLNIKEIITVDEEKRVRRIKNEQHILNL